MALLLALIAISYVTYRGGVGLAGFLNGESVWTKAQKQAVFDLMEYVDTGSPEMLESFDREYALLENDARAREGIYSGTIPSDEVKAVLRRGTDIPEAAPGVTFFLKYGDGIPYVRDALHEWRNSDDDLSDLKSIAERLRLKGAVSKLNAQEKKLLHDHLLSLNQRIEPRTKRFSLSIAQGASHLHLLIFLAFVFVATIAAGIWFRAAGRILGGIRHTEDRLRLLFDTAADAIVVVDHANGNILDANQAAASWCGISVATLRGRPFSRLFDEAMDLGETESGHTRYLVTAHDGRLPVEIQSSMTQVGGESVRLELMRDVTERMNMKRERRVSAVMGHEMRTPLNAIYLATKSLMEPGLSPERIELLNAVNASAQLLLRRITDTIDLVSINEGSFSYTIEPFQLSTLLDRVRGVVVPQANIRLQNVRFHIESDEGAEFLGDIDRLGQAIFNLATNACKFSPEGSEIVVEVREEESLGDRSKLQFRVIDNGIGIPGEAKKYLFRVDHQTAKKRSAHYEGLGLGLFIVKTISEQAGGELSVADNPDPRGGTIFTWVVPLQRARKGQSGDRGARVFQDEVLQRSAASLRCLVADDTRTNRRLLCLALEQLGHQVSEASNGAEALHAMLTAPLDVVLMDMNMPVMTGEAVMAALRGLEDFVSLPVVIAVSADTTAYREAAALESGVMAYLSKPVDLERLVRIFTSIVEQRGMIATTARP
ncbi:hypothetical protein GCM10007898_33230 [Dyella flagellata]|uniref:histidine kinase n=1 Tax=Dyella flagellata TaxID=1867833 RepID=A0ABQ5XDL5_9GAMM|nr:hypothetical protein GCM10007898_33230 [Dyella flagellata]